jgi:tRNA threonylcarbamoyladenosine biosynthesis protein TsaE
VADPSSTRHDAQWYPQPPALAWQGRANTVAETSAVGAAVGGLAQAGDLVALYGDLGAGKTQFVKGLAEVLGVTGTRVSSPTFVIAQEYETHPGKPVLVHVDAYRIQSVADLESIGWRTTATGRAAHDGEFFAGAVVCVEWADKISRGLLPDRLDVRLEHVTEHARTITIVPHGSWVARFDALVNRFRGLSALINTIPQGAQP